MRHNLLAFSLMFLMLILSATAESLLIEPLDDINLVTEDGFETVTFTFINDENISIDIYINTTSSLNGIVFLDDEITVSANSTANVSCVILKGKSATGKIYFNNDSAIIATVNVSIIEDEVTENITIIPSQPTSESNIVFILPIREDATGYLICRETNKVYIIQVNDGVGFVELGDDYGEAYIAIFCKEETYITEFTIDAYFQEELTINMPSATVVNESTEFQVFASGTPIQAELQFKLGKTSITKTTDADGLVSITFNKIGNWSVTAKVFNVEITQNIYVAQKPMEIILPENIYADQEMEISTGKKSDVLISFNELSWSYTTDDSGTISFTPTFPGKYMVQVTTHNHQEGSKNFIAYADIVIEVKDENKIVASIKPHTLYAIYVTDKNNKPIAAKLEIYADGIPIDELDIAGSAVWRSGELHVNYEFKAIPSETGYVENALTLYGKEETMDMGIMISGVATVISIATMILIFLFKREWFYSLHDRYRNRVRNLRKPKAPI